MRKDMIYNGQPMEIIDVDGNKRFIDSEHFNSNKTKFARLLTKYRGNWYFNHMEGFGILLINKENIKTVIN